MPDEKSDSIKPFLVWAGPATDPSGYGEATRNYLNGLIEHGDIDLKLLNKSFWTGDNLDIRHVAPFLEKLVKIPIPDEHDKIAVLFNLTPDNFCIPSGIKKCIGMTTFETDALPAFWPIPIRAMDHLITYSQFNKRTFEDANVNRPIHVIPHGVDTDKYNPDVIPMKGIKDNTKGKFVIGANFDWTARKNPDGLLKAYFEAFSKKDDVVLVLKAYHQFPIEDSVKSIKNNINEVKRQVIKNEDEFPVVMLISEIISSGDMPSFYSALDCYLLPSRGEGWSLTLSEAMSAGLPSIGTNWSGNTEFMTKDNSFLIDYKLVTVRLQDVQRQRQYAGQRWAQPSHDHLVDILRYIYENPDKAKLVGEKAREDMCSKWTWKNACNKLNDLLLEII